MEADGSHCVSVAGGGGWQSRHPMITVAAVQAAAVGSHRVTVASGWIPSGLLEMQERMMGSL
jgi:hypothetical protein